MEATFRRVPGVVSTVVGYTGGWREHPTYAEVCSGSTGHAEAVELEYDPTVVSFEELLEVFWACHDPTTPNRQGPDVGTQYRSAIYCHNAANAAAAHSSKQALERSGRPGGPVVTEICPAVTFWPAEDYHQHHYEKMEL